MRSFLERVLLSSTMLIVGLCQLAVAQQESGKAEEKIDPKTTTRVTLGGSSGAPGTSIVVPIYFTPAQGVEVGRLKLDINYVSANLKFSKLDAGPTAETGNVALHTDVKEAKNEKGVDTQTVTISASLLSPEPPKKGIPAGLLAYLIMQISEKGQATSITLRASTEANELGSTKPLPNVRSSDTKVDVLGPDSQPLVSCFVFSH